MNFLNKFILILAIFFLISGCNSHKTIPLESTDKIVVIGDELTLGFGKKGINFPTELGVIIGNWVVNEGKEGETSESAKERLDEVLKRDTPSHVMIAVGGLDMQQHIEDISIKKNLIEMISIARNNNVIPILVGATRPPVPGSNIKLTDAGFYASLARENNTVYIENAFSEFLNQAQYRATPTTLNKKGYLEVANKVAEQMKDLGFIKIEE